MRLLILGFGNVGKRLVKILSDRRSYPALGGLDAQIVGVVTGRHGSRLDPPGIDPGQLLQHYEEYGAVGAENLSALDAIRDLEFDVLVEMTPLRVDTEGQPATEHCRAALKRGAHVVTANKGPLAFHARELTTLATQENRRLLHESTVMDGAPVFSLAREGLRGCTILGFDAILNSTSNFVLSYLESGRTQEEGILEAQRLGIAEADPSLDLAGWDSAVKVCVLANTLMDGNLQPADIERTGIEAVTTDLISRARQDGGALKLVCEAVRQNGQVKGRVGPRILPPEHILARTGRLGGALALRTDLMTTILIQQHEPTPTDTAYGVLNDLLCLGEE